MYVHRRVLCLMSLLVAFGTPVAAQPLVEDGVVVPLGRVQFEAQAARTLGDVETGVEALARWSSWPRLELRFGTPSYVDTDFGAGFSDPSVGVKAELGPLGAWDLGVLASLSLPLGGELLGSATADPELLVSAARPLGRASIGSHMAIGWDGEADLWLFGGVVSLMLPVGEDWAAYSELDVAWPDGGSAALLSHYGLTYSLSECVQLDAHFGLGMTADAPDALLGVGLTVLR